jgi:peptidoglycan/LPS O-acetylase OafA/YrhL
VQGVKEGVNDVVKAPLQYRGHIPGLDLLRGIAILLVLLYHGVDGRLPWQTLHGPSRYFVYATWWGATGVHLFFILSGFLITGILLDSRAKPDYWKRFYTNRALRILPAYLLMLAVLKLSHTVTWRFVLAAVLYAANMARLFGASNAEYGPLWSLAVEEQFYLLWPLMVRRCSMRTLAKIAIMVIAISPVLFFSIASLGHSIDYYYKLWGNACWLLAGALVAISMRTGALHRANAVKWIYGLLATALISAPFAIYADLQSNAANWQERAIAPFYRFPIAAVYVALLIFVLLRNDASDASAPRRPAAKAAAFLGYVSYGLYLVHSFVFNRLDRYAAATSLARFRGDLSWILATTLAYSLLAIAIAYLSRRYFEEFFLRLKPKPTRE